MGALLAGRGGEAWWEAANKTRGLKPAGRVRVGSAASKASSESSSEACSVLTFALQVLITYAGKLHVVIIADDARLSLA